MHERSGLQSMVAAAPGMPQPRVWRKPKDQSQPLPGRTLIPALTRVSKTVTSWVGCSFI